MPDLRVEKRDHIAIVTLDRPPVNAVDNETLVQIRDVFAGLGDDRDVRVAIFTGAGGKAFCAGADLNPPSSTQRSERHPRELMTIGHDLGRSSTQRSERHPREPMTIGHDLGRSSTQRSERHPRELTDPGHLAREAMWAIIDCAVPVIGAINGYALGAGLAYAACCDMLVASENATFGTPEINVGLLGASAHLSLMMGRHKAREMFLTGEQVSAQEMYRIGAVREVTAPDKLMDTALGLACDLAAKSPIAMRLAKESMNRIEHLPLREGYRTEQDYTTRLLRFDDSREARRAFREKRDPDYKWE